MRDAQKQVVGTDAALAKLQDQMALHEREKQLNQ